MSYMSKIRAQIQFEKDQYESIRMVARRKQISISEAVRQLVRSGMRHGFVEDPPNKIEALLELAGSLNSGLPDLGRNHDEYFVQSIEEDMDR